jgi:hypothetical protein
LKKIGFESPQNLIRMLMDIIAAVLTSRRHGDYRTSDTRGRTPHENQVDFVLRRALS